MLNDVDLATSIAPCPGLVLPVVVYDPYCGHSQHSRSDRMVGATMVKPERDASYSVPHAVRATVHLRLYAPAVTPQIGCRISTTIIAPTPLVAANFMILGQMIVRLGPCYSRLSPMWCKCRGDLFRCHQLNLFHIDPIVFTSCVRIKASFTLVFQPPVC